MKRQLIRLLLITLAFYFIFPHIEGIQVHGGFLHLFVAAIFFSLLGWLVEIIAIAVSAIVTVGTLGLALLIIAPLWLVGFWIIPAVVLKLLAEFMPSYLTIHGWMAAILGGLVMLVIGVLTGGKPSRYRKD